MHRILHLSLVPLTQLKKIVLDQHKGIKVGVNTNYKLRLRDYLEVVKVGEDLLAVLILSILHSISIGLSATEFVLFHILLGIACESNLFPISSNMCIPDNQRVSVRLEKSQPIAHWNLAGNANHPISLAYLLKCQLYVCLISKLDAHSFLALDPTPPFRSLSSSGT